MLSNRVSMSGKHHRRFSSLDGTMRRLRLSDDASSTPSSADPEPELPRRPHTDRPSSRLGSTSQASPVPTQLQDVSLIYLEAVRIISCHQVTLSSPGGGCLMRLIVQDWHFQLLVLR